MARNKSKDKKDREKGKNLQRKVERLRSQLRRYEGALMEPENLDEELEKDFEEKKVKEIKGCTIECHKCGSDMEILELGRYTYKVCTNVAKCWHRQRI